MKIADCPTQNNRINIIFDTSYWNIMKMLNNINVTWDETKNITTNIMTK